MVNEAVLVVVVAVVFFPLQELEPTTQHHYKFVCVVFCFPALDARLREKSRRERRLLRIDGC